LFLLILYLIGTIVFTFLGVKGSINKTDSCFYLVILCFWILEVGCIYGVFNKFSDNFEYDPED